MSLKLGSSLHWCGCTVFGERDGDDLVNDGISFEAEFDPLLHFIFKKSPQYLDIRKNLSLVPF